MPIDIYRQQVYDTGMDTNTKTQEQEVNRTRIHYLRMTPEEYATMHRLAQKNYRTIAGELRMAVRRYIEENAEAPDKRPAA